VAARTPVLVVGEALIDAVINSGEVTGEHVGGSPANVAFGLGALGSRRPRWPPGSATDDRGDRSRPLRRRARHGRRRQHSGERTSVA
jgi:hypothetical protein